MKNTTHLLSVRHNLLGTVLATVLLASVVPLQATEAALGKMVVSKAGGGGTLTVANKSSALREAVAFPVAGAEIQTNKGGVDARMVLVLANGGALVVEPGTVLKFEGYEQPVANDRSKQAPAASESVTLLVLRRGSVFVSTKKLLPKSRIVVATLGGEVRVDGGAQVEISESQTIVRQQRSMSKVSGAALGSRVIEVRAGQQLVLRNTVVPQAAKGS